MAAYQLIARGIRDNNPGNLRDEGIPWNGLLSHDTDGYCIFDTAHNGIRAMAKDLHTKWLRGLDTLAKIIPVYAPPSENPTADYIADIAKWIGLEPDDTVDLSDIDELATIASAMMRQEDGTVPYSAVDIHDACADALGMPS